MGISDSYSTEKRMLCCVDQSALIKAVDGLYKAQYSQTMLTYIAYVYELYVL